MIPTNDPRIFETQWFIDADHPLIENKVFYSKVDNILFYITAHRGVSTDDLSMTNEVKSLTLADDKGFEDTSADAFNALQKFLDTPKQ